MALVNDIESSPNEKVKSVYCFTVAPEYKRKGIATQLLKRVCEDVANDGYDCVEAYPNKDFINVFRDFMGPADMYLRNGFTVFAEFDDITVVRKSLKQSDDSTDSSAKIQRSYSYNEDRYNGITFPNTQ